MDKRFNRILSSGMVWTFLLYFALLLVLGYYSYIAAAVGLVVVIAYFVYYRISARKKGREMRRHMESLAFQVGDASKSSVINFPMPMTVLRVDTGEIIWYNDHFLKASNMQESFFERHITDAIPGFDTRWLLEGRASCPYDVDMLGKKYNVLGNIVQKNGGEGMLATLFWIDVTEYRELMVIHEKVRPVVALVMIDSYEELFKNKSDAEKSSLIAEIENKITSWVEPTKGILSRLERDRYLFIFENQDLIDFVASKFSVIESIGSIKNSNGLSASLSIGVGSGGETLQERYQLAVTALDMALSRGGDQVVVKTPTAFEFFGGRAREVEKRTKVKSRVMANALRQLIKDSENVFIMGHKFSDLDCVGAAAGVCAIVRSCQKPVYFVINEGTSMARELIKQLKAQPEYEGVIITPEQSVEKIAQNSLLIIVDTSRPEIVESQKLLSTIQKIVVIDHHRRAASYIENSTLSLHQTYASSASELVSELLQYIVSPQDILRIEAEAMLAGIVLDTKSFTVKTGVRTFEAAANLRHMGADTIEVKKLFSGSLDDYVNKYRMISMAEQTIPGISFVVSNEPVERSVAAQVADELINLAGIKASFIIFPEEEGASVSARSYGDINVQVVLEKIGGGGSMTMAGAQLAHRDVEEVAGMLDYAVRQYLSEIEAKDEGEQA